MAIGSARNAIEVTDAPRAAPPSFTARCRHSGSAVSSVCAARQSAGSTVRGGRRKEQKVAPMGEGAVSREIEWLRVIDGREKRLSRERSSWGTRPRFAALPPKLFIPRSPLPERLRLRARSGANGTRKAFACAASRVRVMLRMRSSFCVRFQNRGIRHNEPGELRH